MSTLGLATNTFEAVVRSRGEMDEVATTDLLEGCNVKAATRAPIRLANIRALILSMMLLPAPEVLK